MTPGDGVIDALNAALKYERTIAACLRGYHEYFERWRFHRLKCWFKQQAKEACKRIDCLEDRINRLDTIPSNDAYEFDVEPVEVSSDIVKVWDYFLTMCGEARDEYEKSRGICKDADDSVSAKVCGKGKAGVEDLLWRVEAKANKIKLIGPDLYLAHHMHEED